MSSYYLKDVGIQVLDPLEHILAGIGNLRQYCGEVHTMVVIEQALLS